MSTRRAEPFSATVARLRARPMPPRRVPVGLHGDQWGDRHGVPYRLVDPALAPEHALALAGRGARVVYDGCGCGGAECGLDWLSEGDVRDLVRLEVVPSLHPTRHGRAELEHWRSAAGQDLVVAAVQVSRGDRIRE